MDDIEDANSGNTMQIDEIKFEIKYKIEAVNAQDEANDVNSTYLIRFEESK